MVNQPTSAIGTHLHPCLQLPLTTETFPVAAAQSQNIISPALCLTVGQMFFSCNSAPVIYFSITLLSAAKSFYFYTSAIHWTCLQIASGLFTLELLLCFTHHTWLIAFWLWSQWWQKKRPKVTQSNCQLLIIKTHIVCLHRDVSWFKIFLKVYFSYWPFTYCNILFP